MSKNKVLNLCEYQIKELGTLGKLGRQRRDDEEIRTGQRVGKKKRKTMERGEKQKESEGGDREREGGKKSQIPRPFNREQKPN